MTINERIISALAHFGDPVVPGLYMEEATQYYTFNYDILPDQFASDMPWFYRALIQIHLFCPLRRSSIRQRRETVRALVGAGFTWPEVIDASGRDCQHFVFECEAMIERTELYGE